MFSFIRIARGPRLVKRHLLCRKSRLVLHTRPRGELSFSAEFELIEVLYGKWKSEDSDVLKNQDEVLRVIHGRLVAECLFIYPSSIVNAHRNAHTDNLVKSPSNLVKNPALDNY